MRCEQNKQNVSEGIVRMATLSTTQLIRKNLGATTEKTETSILFFKQFPSEDLPYGQVKNEIYMLFVADTRQEGFSTPFFFIRCNQNKWKQTCTASSAVHTCNHHFQGMHVIFNLLNTQLTEKSQRSPTPPKARGAPSAKTSHGREHRRISWCAAIL